MTRQCVSFAEEAVQDDFEDEIFLLNIQIEPKKKSFIWALSLFRVTQFDQNQKKTKQHAV